MKLLLLPFLLLSPLFLAAQQPTSTSAQPMVGFRFVWNQGFPWTQYSIEVEADGKTHFNGVPHAEGTEDADPYHQDFTMSEANRQKIFDLAQKLNYFRGDYDSHLKRIARTGEKTLRYQSAEIQGATSYNWSQNADIQELTQTFLAIANTLDYGRKLAFQYRYDKLGMDQRLKELADLESAHNAQELQAIAPILKKIARDPNMMNISRQTAQRLLESIGQSRPVGQVPSQQ